jgi:hypothetical protein
MEREIWIGGIYQRDGRGTRFKMAGSRLKFSRDVDVYKIDKRDIAIPVWTF